jgi:hypothetical protein
MQQDFTMRTETGDCIGSEVLTYRVFSVSEVSSVLQAGHSHLYPSFLNNIFVTIGCIRKQRKGEGKTSLRLFL